MIDALCIVLYLIVLFALGFYFFRFLLQQKHLIKAFWFLLFNDSKYKLMEEDFNKTEEAKELKRLNENGKILKGAILRGLRIIYSSVIFAFLLAIFFSVIPIKPNPFTIELIRLIGYAIILWGIAGGSEAYFVEKKHITYASLAVHLNMLWHKGMYYIGGLCISFSYIIEIIEILHLSR